MNARTPNRTFITRMLCLLMALHFFNFSIDSRDANPDYIPEDLAINDIESVIELFTEDIFGIHNAIAEHDEPDNSDGGCFEFSKIFIKNSELPIALSTTVVFDDKSYFIADSPIGDSISKAIISPPPQFG